MLFEIVSKANVVKMMRKTLEWELKSIARLLEVVSVILFCGTKTEVMWLTDLLKRQVNRRLLKKQNLKYKKRVQNHAI